MATDTVPSPFEVDLETWRNVTRGRVVIKRVGEYGKPYDQMVEAGRTVQLTPRERRVNEDAVARDEYNPFTNGTLIPERLVDGDADNERLTVNPNKITDDEAKQIFRLRGERFTDRIEAIDSLPVVERLLELVEEPRLQVTVAQNQVLKIRQRALKTPSGASRRAEQGGPTKAVTTS